MKVIERKILIGRKVVLNMIKHALVSGGTGVTGNALVRYLVDHDIETTVLIRPLTARAKFLPHNPHLHIIACELQNYSTIIPELKQNKYDVFFHLAWDGSQGEKKIDNRYNCYLQNKNVEYSLGAVDLCHKINCPTFIMTGSQAEYGPKSGAITEDMEKHPDNAYGMAKLCAENMTRLMCRQYGIRHIWPILFSVYGPNDGTKSLVDMTIRALREKKDIPYTGCEQVWDYLYSYDAAKALFLLAQYGHDGECYNVAYGQSYTLKHYIDIIYSYFPEALRPRYGEIPYQAGQLMCLCAKIDKLISHTHFKPEYDFTAGIKYTLQAR